MSEATRADVSSVDAFLEVRYSPNRSAALFEQH